MIQRTIIVCTVLALSVSGFLLSRMATAAPQSQDAKASSQPLPRTDSAGGMASGGAHAAVLDALNRPITAGGFVDSGTILKFRTFCTTDSPWMSTSRCVVAMLALAQKTAIALLAPCLEDRAKGTNQPS
jgi:hypothetical protein